MRDYRDDLYRVRMPDGRRLIGASFRGVPFFVESADRSSGRRTVLHEFPLRDDPYVEDLGRKARVFQVEGYLLGENHLVARDRLLAALEDTAGPGELIHPYYGVRRAICSGLTSRENTADGGLVRLSIEFTETPAQAFVPTEVVDWPAKVDASADAAQAASKGEFLSHFDPLRLPSFALQGAVRFVETASEDVADGLLPIVRSTQELAALNARLHVITAQARAMVRQPALVADAFGSALAAIPETILDAPGKVRDGLIAAYGTLFPIEPPLTTATRRREHTNQVALASMLRRTMAVEAARLTVRISYASIEEATLDRDAIAALLEAESNTAGDELYAALVQLRADVTQAVPGDDVLARIVTVSRPVAVPSLVLSYQLYGSVEPEADVIARNRARHPGFMAGEIQVLTDV